MKAEKNFKAEENFYNHIKNMALINILMEVICDYYKCTERQLKSGRRNGNLVKARKMFYKVTTEEHGISLSEAGTFFGQDHVTVLHAKKTFKENTELQETIQTKYNDALPEIKIYVAEIKESANKVINLFKNK